MIHSSHIRRGRSPPPSMYSSYVTRTGLHKILPFHRILFGRISYCSALYFDTATPGPSGRTLNTEYAAYIYIYIYSVKQSGIRFYRGRGASRNASTNARYGQSSLVYGERPFAALSFIFSILATRCLRLAPICLPPSSPLRSRENDIYPSEKDVVRTSLGFNIKGMKIFVYVFD